MPVRRAGLHRDRKVSERDLSAAGAQGTERFDPVSSSICRSITLTGTLIASNLEHVRTETRSSRSMI